MKLTKITSSALIGLFVFLISCQENTEMVTELIDPDEKLSAGSLTSFDFSENAFGEPIPGLSTRENNAFVIGNSFFRNNWTTAPASATARDGLGPIFNATSCGGCHAKDGRAQPPLEANGPLDGLLFRLSIPGSGFHGEPLVESNYGEQLNDRAIPGAKPEGHVKISYTELDGTYADGIKYSLQKPNYEFLGHNLGPLDSKVLVSPRIAQQIPGLGLLENIPEAAILVLADENDLDQDGISGRPNYVWNRELQKTTLGRFGWKANQPSLLQQTAAAFLGDIGITSSMFPTENLIGASLQFKNLPNGGNPEISDQNLANVVSYVQTLSVPARRNYTNQKVLRGKQIFIQLNCSGCHTPSFRTSNASSIIALNNQKIFPYTDLLIHDMGPKLADNRPDFQATGTEWRTPPLWGIGMIKTVNRHTSLLHDGRARNMEEAILWHGGEAQKSTDDFKQLKLTDRMALLSFLEDL